MNVTIGSTTTVDPAQRHKATLAKIILLLALLIITMVFGLITLILRKTSIDTQPEPRRHRYAFIFTLLSCYGGGVFLATCLLDLLPDAITDVVKGLETVGSTIVFPLAEFLIACGFFLVLLIEQIVLYLREADILTSKKKDEATMIAQEHSTTNLSFSHDNSRTDLIRSASHAQSQQRSLPDISRHSSEPNIAILPDLKIRRSTHSSSQCRDQTTSTVELNASHSSILQAPDTVSIQQVTDVDPPQDVHSGHVHGHSHDPHFDPESHSTMRAIILVFALSLHSIFEGLALGLEPTAKEAIQIFLALILHKSIISFSLGIRLVQSRLKGGAIFLCILTFAIMAPIGGFIGIGVIDAISPEDAALVSGSLTAIACGTFLYVTCFEILPHELNESGNRLSKLITLLLGFFTIGVMILLLPD